MHINIELLEEYCVSQKDQWFERVLHLLDHRHERHFLLWFINSEFPTSHKIIDYSRKREIFSRNLKSAPDVEYFGIAFGCSWFINLVCFNRPMRYD